MPNIMDICYCLYDSYGCVGHYGQGGANYGHIIFLARAFAPTVQTKKITQNVGRSILVPDFWIWRPVYTVQTPRSWRPVLRASGTKTWSKLQQYSANEKIYAERGEVEFSTRFLGLEARG